MNDEVWKDVEGYEGWYQVSNKGRCRSVDRMVNYKHGKKRKQKGVILKGSLDGYGYIMYGFRKNHSKNTPHSNSKAHWLVMKAFGEPQPEWATMVNHIDGDKTNNAIDNLEWSNVQLNNQHYNDHLRDSYHITYKSTSRRPVVAYLESSSHEFIFFYSSKCCADYLERPRQTLLKALKRKGATNGYQVRYLDEL